MYKYAEIVEERVSKNIRVTSITPVTLDDIASYFFLQNAREQL